MFQQLRARWAPQIEALLPIVAVAVVAWGANWLTAQATQAADDLAQLRAKTDAAERTYRRVLAMYDDAVAAKRRVEQGPRLDGAYPPHTHDYGVGTCGVCGADGVAGYAPAEVDTATLERVRDGLAQMPGGE